MMFEYLSPRRLRELRLPAWLRGHSKQGALAFGAKPACSSIVSIKDNFGNDCRIRPGEPSKFKRLAENLPHRKDRQKAFGATSRATICKFGLAPPSVRGAL
jgi:hypothetical protein